MIAHFGQKAPKARRAWEQACLLSETRPNTIRALRHIGLEEEAAELVELQWYMKAAARNGSARNVYKRLSHEAISGVLSGRRTILPARRGWRHGWLITHAFPSTGAAGPAAANVPDRRALIADTSAAVEYIDSLIADLKHEGVDCPRCIHHGVKGTGRNVNQVQSRSSDEGARYSFKCNACAYEWDVN